MAYALAGLLIGLVVGFFLGGYRVYAAFCESARNGEYEVLNGKRYRMEEVTSGDAAKEI